MVAAKQLTGPVCGFTVITPHGEEELMNHVGMHEEDEHPDMQMTPDQVKSLVKNVEMRKPMM